MVYRIATINDYPPIHKVRMSVLENILSDPSKITKADYQKMIEKKGKGWVCEIGGMVVGFSIVDVPEQNVWALFVLPEYEKRGIGKQLQQLMLDWYFEQGHTYLWLSTDPGTRAEKFYEKTGWKRVGLLPNGEMKFERFGK